MSMRAALLAIALGAIAQFLSVPSVTLAAELPKDYPARPVRLIVPFPPGGSNDILGRFMAARLTERFGQQVIVDNRPGADGLIGSDIAARSVPDGHTLLIVSTSYAMNPAVHKKMPFDPLRDLRPVALIGTGPNAIATFPGFPVHTIRELVASAKNKPGQINYASSGIGGFNHFSGELFKIAAGVEMVHVPYKGGGPAMIDLMAGHVPVMFSTLIQVLPHARSGKLRVLATGGPKRAPSLANVPTVIESGVPGYEVTIWWGFLAPAALPNALNNRLNTIVGQVLAEADTQKRLAAEAAETEITSPDAFANLIRSDIAKWAKVAREAKIQAH